MIHRLLFPLALLFLVFAGCHGEVAPATAPSAVDPSTPKPAATEASPSEPAPTASSGSTPEPAPTTCHHDAECTLSTFAGCCACCPSLPHAFLRATLARIEARCTTVCPPCNARCGPEPSMDGYFARCVNQSCLAVPE